MSDSGFKGVRGFPPVKGVRGVSPVHVITSPEHDIAARDVALSTASVLDRAELITVASDTEYSAAGTLLAEVIVPMLKEVHETFDPICSKLNDAHLEATSQRAKYLGPLEQARDALKGRMLDFSRAKKLASQTAEREARQEADEAAAKLAKQLKRGGATKKEVEAAATVVVPPSAPPAAAPKVAGIKKTKRWVFETLVAFSESERLRAVVHDVEAGLLPPDVLKVDQAALNAWAKATKGISDAKLTSGKCVELEGIAAG